MCAIRMISFWELGLFRQNSRKYRASPGLSSINKQLWKNNASNHETTEDVRQEQSMSLNDLEP